MSRPASSADAHPALAQRGSAGLWFAVCGGPAAWFVSLVVGYFAVHDVCRVNTALGPRLVSLVALIVAVAAGLTGRAIWTQVDRRPAAAGEHVASERTRFMAQIGVLGGSVFSLMILLQIVATFIITGCHDRPRTPEAPDVLTPPALHMPRDRA